LIFFDGLIYLVLKFMAGFINKKQTLLPIKNI
jgi:hypothetical protein